MTAEQGSAALASAADGGEAVAALQGRVETALRDVLEEELASVSAEIAEPIRYAVLGPGKRIRPLLLVGAYRACGGRQPGVARLGCAVEFVHAYSLVHDDLPCMDDDALRRGRPTLHVRWGPAAAVLAGATLMPLAVRVIARAGAAMGLGEARVRRLVATLAAAAGARGMVGGQLLDLQAEGRVVGGEELERIHAGKTAQLIAAAAVMGGVAAGAPESVVTGLARFGRRLGLAFQAVDDILDLTGTDRELGKQAGRDAALGKATYPSVFGLEEAERISQRLGREALEELAALSDGAELRQIAAYVMRRRR